MRYTVGALSIIFGLIQVILVASADAEIDGSEDWDISQREFSAEVFLNSQRIEFDNSTLEALVDSKEANIIDGAYVYRAHHDERLFVMVRYDNMSGAYGPWNPPLKLTGPSVKIGIPVEIGTYSVDMEIREFTEVDEYIGPDERWLLDERGYHIADPTLDQLKDHNITYSKNRTTISFDLEKGSFRIRRINVMGPALSDIDDDMGALFEELGMEPGAWSDTPTTSEEVELDLAVSEISREDVEWTAAMEAELEWLKQRGVIGGIDDDEIIEISNSSAPGRAGPNNRIVYFKGILGNENGTWVPYLQTTFPLITDRNLDDGIHITSEDLPGTDDEFFPSPSDDEIPWRMIIATSIVVLIVLMGVARIAVRVQARNLLKNANRKHILEIVKKDPGIHFRHLMREMDMKQGALSYHLNKMEKAELIRSRQDGMYRRFYPFNSKVDMKLALSDIQKDILFVIQTDPGINQSSVSKRTGRNHVLIHYHLQFLKEAGMVWIEKEGRETKLFLTPVGTNMATS